MSACVYTCLNMCACLCVCAHVCICVKLWACVCMCVHTCVSGCECVCMCEPVCTHVSVSVCLCTCLVCTHVSVHVSAWWETVCLPSRPCSCIGSRRLAEGLHPRLALAEPGGPVSITCTGAFERADFPSSSCCLCVIAGGGSEKASPARTWLSSSPDKAGWGLGLDVWRA